MPQFATFLCSHMSLTSAFGEAVRFQFPHKEEFWNYLPGDAINVLMWSNFTEMLDINQHLHFIQVGSFSGMPPSNCCCCIFLLRYFVRITKESVHVR